MLLFNYILDLRFSHINKERNTKMKKIASVLLIITLLFSCVTMSACENSTTKNTPTSVVILATSDGSAELIKAKIEAKTGEKIDIVTQDNVGESTVIVIDRFGSDSFDSYGWTARENRITVVSNVLTDFNTVADAFVSKISNLESIKTIQSETLKTPSENSILSATDYMFSEISAKAEAFKGSVLSTPAFDVTTIGGSVYYVSNNGNDENNGTSPETAWATLSKANSASLNQGDAILFECGSVFRGTISAQEGVTYASYGTGNKPIIIQSKQNYAQDGLWELYDAEHNIWKLKTYVSDPGIIVFNAKLDAVDCYGEITATRVWNKADDSATRCPYNDLTTTTEDLVYYWGTPTSTYTAFNQNSFENVLYLRSEKNPNTDYESIEIGEDIAIVSVGSKNNVTIDGICFKYGGGHCVSGSTMVENLTVRNCVFAWIGGGLLNGVSADNKSSRYGNAVEIFGGCDGFYVYNNWIYEIFDTGITFQYHYASGTSKMVNIEIYDNLVERSYWCLEWWISPRDGAQKNPEVANVYVHDNILREGFDSWGTLQHSNPEWGAMLSSGFGTINLSNFKLENNIFDRTFIEGRPDLTTRMLVISVDDGNADIEYTGNVFLQYKNQYIAKINYDSNTSTSFTTTKTQIKRLINMTKDTSGCDLSGNFFCIAEDSQ